MTTTFRRDAPVSWVAGIKTNRRIGVRPTGIVAGSLLTVAALAALAVAGWGAKDLSILWGAAAIVALAGVVLLTLRGFPIFAILTVVAGSVAWGLATRGRLPDGWLDILGILKFAGINLAFVVPLAGTFLSALLLDARRVARLSIDEAVSGRRWWGKPDDHLPRLRELEAIPSARFFALGEGGCTHLVAAGRRVALFLPTVWPNGEFTMDAEGQVLRGGHLFVPGSEDVDGLAAEVHTWREQLSRVGGSVRGYLVVEPARGDVSEDLVISVAPGEHLHLVHAHEMAEAAGRWLSAEPYRVDLHVMERLLVIAAGNKLPEPLPLPRTFAREASAPSAGRTWLPTDAAFAAAAREDAPLAPPPLVGSATGPAAPAATWRPGNGVMRARLGRLARGTTTRADDPDADARPVTMPAGEALATVPDHQEQDHAFGASARPRDDTLSAFARDRDDASATPTSDRGDMFGSQPRDRDDAFAAPARDQDDPFAAPARGASSASAHGRDDAFAAPARGASGASAHGRDDAFAASAHGRDDAFAASARDRDDAFGPPPRERGDAFAASPRERDEAFGPSRRERDDMFGASSRGRDGFDRDAAGRDGRADAAHGGFDRDASGRDGRADAAHGGFDRSAFGSDDAGRDGRTDAGRTDAGRADVGRGGSSRGGFDPEIPGLSARTAGSREADVSWEARSTRELVGNWDNDSASRLAAWAAEDNASSYGTTPATPPTDDPRAGGPRAEGEAGSRSWSSPGASWSGSAGGDASGNDERSRWSSAADDFPVTYEPDPWTGAAAAEPPARDENAGGRRAWAEAEQARTASERDTDAARPARERPVVSWIPAPAPTPPPPPSWRSAFASDGSGASPGAGGSPSPAPAPQPSAGESWRASFTPERPSEPSAPASAPSAGPSWREPSGSDRPSAAPMGDGPSAGPTWRDSSGSERPPVAPPVGDGPPAGVSWRDPFGPGPQAGASGGSFGPGPQAGASGGSFGSGPPPGAFGSGPASGAPAGDGPSAGPSWRDSQASYGPGESSGGTAGRGYEPRGEASAQAGRRRAEERPSGERPAWGGSLFEGEAPELVANPLELRRSWDSDAASRSIRRRDRVQPAEDGAEAAEPAGRTGDWASAAPPRTEPEPSRARAVAKPVAEPGLAGPRDQVGRSEPWAGGPADGDRTGRAEAWPAGPGPGAGDRGGRAEARASVPVDGDRAGRAEAWPAGPGAGDRGGRAEARASVPVDGDRAGRAEAWPPPGPGAGDRGGRTEAWNAGPPEGDRSGRAGAWPGGPDGRAPQAPGGLDGRMPQAPGGPAGRMPQAPGGPDGRMPQAPGGPDGRMPQVPGGAPAEAWREDRTEAWSPGAGDPRGRVDARPGAPDGRDPRAAGGAPAEAWREDRTEAWSPGAGDPRGRAGAWPAAPDGRPPQAPGGAAEEAWWDGGASGPPAEAAEKPKRLRWGRNKDKSKGKDAADTGGRGDGAAPSPDWAREPARGSGDSGDWASGAGRGSGDSAGWGSGAARGSGDSGDWASGAARGSGDSGDWASGAGRGSGDSEDWASEATSRWDRSAGRPEPTGRRAAGPAGADADRADWPDRNRPAVDRPDQTDRGPAGGDRGRAAGDWGQVGGDRGPAAGDRAGASSDRGQAGGDRGPVSGGAGGDRGRAGGDWSNLGGDRSNTGGNRGGQLPPGRFPDDGSPSGERIPEQRKRDLSAFEDLAPLELNLDEEPKAEKSRRFLRRK